MVICRFQNQTSSPRPYHTTVPNVLSSRMGHIHNALSLAKHGRPTTGHRFVKRAACHDGNMRQALAVLINDSPMDLWPSYLFYLIGYSRGWGFLKMNSKRTCHLKSQFKGKYSLWLKYELIHMSLLFSFWVKYEDGSYHTLEYGLLFHCAKHLTGLPWLVSLRGGSFSLILQMRKTEGKRHW